MMKQALGVLMVLAALGWVAGCSTGGATTPAPAPAAKPEETKKPETAAAPAKVETAKPAEQETAPRPESVPAGAAVVTVVAGVQLKIIYFDFDKYEIKPVFRDDIKSNAQQLNKDPGVKVTIEGHCDERGSTEYNLALGERRATAVQKALLAQGVAAARMKVVSYGEERPVDPGHNEDAWAKNRRGSLTQ